MNILFLGAPGAGKGTQADRVSAKCGIPTISTGAIIREAIKAGTPMGLAARSYTESGALVPDDVVIGIIRERLAQDDCREGFILDGFPRTLPQAQALDKMGVKIDLALSLEVGDDAIVERMSGRRVCEKCGASYHILYNPPRDGATCDKDGTPLTRRADDDPAVVRERLATYHRQTEPLKEYYQKAGVLRSVEGQASVEDTSALVLAVLDEVSGKAAE